MRGRPRTPTENYGTIHTRRTGATWEASTYARNSTGRVQRIRKRGHTKPQAVTSLKEAVKELISPTEGDLHSGSTVKELCEKWLLEFDQSKRSQGTKNAYRAAVEGVIIPGLGDVALNECGVPRVDRFITGVKPGRQKNVRAALKQAFALAVRHGVMSKNPMESVAVYIAPEKKNVEALEPKQIKQLFGHLAKYDDAHTSVLLDGAVFMAGTGARIGETMASMFPDFNLAKGIVSLNYTTQEDSDGKLFRQENGKGRGSDRDLVMPNKVVLMLKRRQLAAVTDLVFPSARLTMRWPNNYRRQWREALKDSKFEGVSPKWLRRSVATQIAHEIGSEAAAKQLGHTDDEITMQHYIQAQRELVDFTTVLDGLMGEVA